MPSLRVPTLHYTVATHKKTASFQQEFTVCVPPVFHFEVLEFHPPWSNTEGVTGTQTWKGGEWLWCQALKLGHKHVIGLCCYPLALPLWAINLFVFPSTLSLMDMLSLCFGEEGYRAGAHSYPSCTLTQSQETASCWVHRKNPRRALIGSE